MRRWGLLTIGLVLLGGTGIGIAMSRHRKQPSVRVSALPLVASARLERVYVDCSKINAVAYFEHNPCQTFAVLTGGAFESEREFWVAETRTLQTSGWHHSAAQLVDYDATNSGMASRRESWVAPSHHACAYVTTARKGLAAESRALFPPDPYDIPHGLYVFYRKAKAAEDGVRLWVRLRPPNPGGRCIG